MKIVAGDPMRVPNRPKAIIEEVFMAGLCSNVKCLSCNRMSRTFDPTFDILLEISFNKRELLASLSKAKSFYKHVPKSSSIVTTVSETKIKQRPASKSKKAGSPKSLFTCFKVLCEGRVNLRSACGGPRKQRTTSRKTEVSHFLKRKRKLPKRSSRRRRSGLHRTTKCKS